MAHFSETRMRTIVKGLLFVLLATGRAGWGQDDGQVRPANVTDRRVSAARLADAREVRQRLGLVPEQTFSFPFPRWCWPPRR